MDAVSLEDEIIRLLALGYEGEYWDFKSDYTDVKEDKLIDVICMANNLCDRDAFLIHGADNIIELVLFHICIIRFEIPILSLIA